MRSLLIAAVASLALTACATQTTPPAAAPVAAAPDAAAKAPQCWNGDAGKFENVGAQVTISSVKVACEKTSDGKNAQWMGVKAK